MAVSVESRAGGRAKLRVVSALLAAVVCCAVAAAGTGAASGQSSGACLTTIKLGFGPYLEKNPPTANFELRGVVHPACGKPPHGSCVSERKSGQQWVSLATVPVVPASGRCRFILTLPASFAPSAIRVRYAPASGFAASEATITLRDNATGPFPPDLGAKSTSQSGTTTSSSSGSGGATRIVGIVFLDTAQSGGGQAATPAGTKIYPPGSTVSGSVGCQTTPTNGQLFLVFNYSGSPTAGSINLTAPQSGGGTYPHAPIGIDVNPGQTVQFLGVPVPLNGTYALSLQLLGAHPQTLNARFTLALAC
jgi:hypothetical protein